MASISDKPRPASEVIHVGKIESTKGNSSQSRAYISKTGKWADDKKAETVISFEEFGILPDDSKQGKRNDYVILHSMVKDGYSDIDIMEELPQYMLKIDKIGQARQRMIAHDNSNIWRDLHVE